MFTYFLVYSALERVNTEAVGFIFTKCAQLLQCYFQFIFIQHGTACTLQSFLTSPLTLVASNITATVNYLVNNVWC